MKGYIVTRTLNGCTEILGQLVLEREQAESIRDNYIKDNPVSIFSVLRIHVIDLDGICHGCPVLDKLNRIMKAIIDEEDDDYDIPE